MNKKAKNALLGGLVTLLVVTAAWGFYERIHTASLGLQSIKVQKEYTAQQKAYKAKYNQIETDLINSNGKTNNAALKSMTTNISALNIADSYNRKLFKAVYTFSNVKQYNGRADSVKSYTSDDVRKNTDLFGGTDGSKEVSSLGLASTFDNVKTYLEKVDGNNIVSLAKVTYDSGYNGTTNGVGTRVYEVTYDQSQQKITNVKLVD